MPWQAGTDWIEKPVDIGILVEKTFAWPNSGWRQRASRNVFAKCQGTLHASPRPQNGSPQTRRVGMKHDLQRLPDRIRITLG